MAGGRRESVLLRMSRRTRVPVIRQQEAAECGLAALAMVAAHHGYLIDLSQLRRRVPTSSRGMNLRNMLEAASVLRLSGRALRLSIDELGKLSLPSILHWQMGHFVVLVKLLKNGAIVHDPARGRCKVSNAQLHECFTGVALELEPMVDFRPGSHRGRLTLTDFARSFSGLGGYLSLILIVLIATQALALVPPVATQLLIDDVLLSSQPGSLRMAFLGLGLVMLVTVLLETLHKWVSLYVGTHLALRSSTNTIRHLLFLPVKYFHNRHVGDLLSRVDSLSPIRNTLLESSVTGLVHGVVILATLALMFFYSTQLSVLTLLGLALSSVIGWSILPASRRLTEQALLYGASHRNSLLETLRATSTVKALGLELTRWSAWHNDFVSATDTRFREMRLGLAGSFLLGLVNVADQLLFLGIGIHGVIEQQLTIGMLFAFLTLRGRFRDAAMSLAAIAKNLFMLPVHIERVSDILLSDAEAEPPAGAVITPLTGAINVQHLSFNYPGERNLFTNLSFSIKASEAVVLTGPTGCGKSTLLMLLATQLVPSRGSLSFDAVDVRLRDVRNVRSQLGVVLQDDRLFRGSIAENIAAFDPAIRLERVRAAARAAAILSDIESMPMSFNTLLSGMGDSLSGGQRQRLLLARALYRRPRILLLDEATSHLDIASEKQVLDNLEQLGITIISVAHRPQVLHRAQRIIRLQSPDRQAVKPGL